MLRTLLRMKEPFYIARQEVALEPAFALMFGEHLEDSSVRPDVIVGRQELRDRHAVGHVEDGVPTVRRRLVGRKDSEVARVGISREDLLEESALYARRLRVRRARPRDAQASRPQL